MSEAFSFAEQRPAKQVEFLDRSSDCFSAMELKCRTKIRELWTDNEINPADAKLFSRTLIRACNLIISDTLETALSLTHQPDDKFFFFSPGYPTLFGEQFARLEGTSEGPWPENPQNRAQEFHLKQGSGNMCAEAGDATAGFVALTAFMTELYEKELDGRRVFGLTRWFSELFEKCDKTSVEPFLGLEIVRPLSRETATSSRSHNQQSIAPKEADEKEFKPSKLLRLVLTEDSPISMLRQFEQGLRSALTALYDCRDSDAIPPFPIVRAGGATIHDSGLDEAFAWLFWSIFYPIGQSDIERLQEFGQRCSKARPRLAKALSELCQFFLEELPSLGIKQIQLTHYYALVTQPGIPLKKSHGMFEAKSAIATINLYTQFELPRTFLLMLRRSVTAVYELIQDIEIVVTTATQTKKTTLDDISHEVKQVANALLGAWSIEPDEILDRSLAAYFERLGYEHAPESVTICPEPRLISAAAKVMQLWTGSRDPVSFFAEAPKSLVETMRGIWGVVLDSASGILSRKFRFDDADDHRQYAERQKLLDKIFSFDAIFVVQADSKIPLPQRGGDRSINERWSTVIQVLFAKFKDVIRHAHPEKDKTIRVSVDQDDLVIEIDNHCRTDQLDDIDSEPILELYAALEEVSLFTSTRHGTKLLNNLQQDSGGFFEMSAAVIVDGHYVSAVTFHWGEV